MLPCSTQGHWIRGKIDPCPEELLMAFSFQHTRPFLKPSLIDILYALSIETFTRQAIEKSPS